MLRKPMTNDQTSFYPIFRNHLQSFHVVRSTKTPSVIPLWAAWRSFLILQPLSSAQEIASYSSPAATCVGNKNSNRSSRLQYPGPHIFNTPCRESISLFLSLSPLSLPPSVQTFAHVLASFMLLLNQSIVFLVQRFKSKTI